MIKESEVAMVNRATRLQPPILPLAPRSWRSRSSSQSSRSALPPAEPAITAGSLRAVLSLDVGRSYQIARGAAVAGSQPWTPWPADAAADDPAPDEASRSSCAAV